MVRKETKYIERIDVTYNPNSAKEYELVKRLITGCVVVLDEFGHIIAEREHQEFGDPQFNDVVGDGRFLG